MSRAGRRRLVALGLAATAILATAGPAGADPARPTDFRSEVTGADPALPDGVEAEVVGGDAFLQLTVDGHEVVVTDYAGPEGATVPYLRFGPDGTVEENLASAASAANESRYGTADAAPDRDAGPRWEVVATDGTYAWHDHRIHWMAPSRAPVTADDGRVDLGGPDGGWAVDLVVDGTATTLRGTLEVEPAPPMWPAALGVIALALGGVALADRRGPGALLVPGALAAAAALGASIATWQTAPSHARPSVVPLVVAAVALVAAAVAGWSRGRVRLAATAACSAGLVGWAVLRVGVLTHAVLPTDLAPTADRAATVAALGVGAAIGAFLIWRPTAERGRAPS